MRQKFLVKHSVFFDCLVLNYCEVLQMFKVQFDFNTSNNVKQHVLFVWLVFSCWS